MDRARTLLCLRAFTWASVRPYGGGGTAVIQWCCDFNSGPRTGGLFSSVAMWVTVQSSLGWAVKPVRLRNERRWESKTQSRTKPWWTDLKRSSHTGRWRQEGGMKETLRETPIKWKYACVEKEAAEMERSQKARGENSEKKNSSLRGNTAGMFSYQSIAWVRWESGDTLSSGRWRRWTGPTKQWTRSVGTANGKAHLASWRRHIN